MWGFVTLIFFRCSYFVVLGAFLLWARSIHASVVSQETSNESRRGNPVLTFLRRERFAWIAAALLTASVCWAVAAKFRVLTDEAALTLVGKSMFEFKTVHLPVSGKYSFGTFLPMDSLIPNRPLLYPFLVSLAYTLGGESMTSVFAVNAWVLYALLVTTMIVVGRFSGRLVALGVACLVISHPIVVYSARSAGFDLLACLFFFWSLLAIANYLRNPGPAHFALAWMTLVMFAHVRYESIALIPVVGLILASFHAIRRTDLVRNSWLLACTPLLFFPHLAQQLLIDHRTVNYSPEPAFSATHFVENGRILLESLLEDNATLLPYNRIMLMVGALCGLDLAWRLARRKIRIPPGPWRPFWATVIAGALLFNGIYLAHFRGGVFNPTEARFFNLLCLCSVFLVAVQQHLRMPVSWKPAFLATSMTLLIGLAAVSIGQRQTNALTVPREAERIAKILGTPGDRPPLIIADRPMIYLAMGFGAVGFPFAASHSLELLSEFKRALHPRLLVIQRIEHETGLPFPEMTLPKEYALETVESFQTADGYLSRLSQVVTSGESR